MWDKYRDRVLASNPNLEDPTVTMRLSAGEFLRHLRRAYEAGMLSVMETEQAARDFVGIKPKDETLPDFLRSLFTNNFGL